jgi:cell division septation protein DedD
VNIQRADVPDRGTFYRVRVGPFSQNDAAAPLRRPAFGGRRCVLAKR